MLIRWLACVGIPLVWVASALAADLPIEGRRMVLRASAKHSAARGMRIISRDAAIAAPLPDPRLGSRLVISGGAAAGHCFAEIPLDPSLWVPIRNDGVNRGWRYRAPKPGTQGVRAITLKPGRLVVRAAGADWPCGLSAGAQRLPVRVEIRAGATRYCAEFGGEVQTNKPGRFRARDAPAPAVCSKRDLTLANLNLLHGLGCSPGSCRQDDRIDLLFQWVAQAGCPDIVTLQEIWSPMVPKIQAHLVSVCPFAYEMEWGQANNIDDSIVLSRYPVASTQVVSLHNGFRNVLHVRVDHPLGPVDVFSTHLASSSDGGPSACQAPCPLACVSAGAITNRECQAVQTALLVESVHDVSTPAVLAGDFNTSPFTFTYDQQTDRGWVDTYLAAGQPECAPSTGIGCTSGRDSSSITEIESSDPNVDARIDYAFLIPPTVRSCQVELAGDPDGDGTATQVFADDPNPFAVCGAAPLPVCWSSDHEGVELDLNCD